MSDLSQSEKKKEIVMMQSPQTIRTRCRALLELGYQDKLPHFRVRRGQIAEVAKFVAQVTKENYPDGKIPYHSRWGHFGVGGVDRVKWLATRKTQTGKIDILENARVFYDLVVPSILLDAGAGMKWQYLDRQRGLTFNKSEGLAVASFDMFAEGLFSSDPKNPFQSDATGLENLRPDVLQNAFQVTSENPLIGTEGRLLLLRNLGKALRQDEFFGGVAKGRMGALVDYFIEKFGAEEIAAPDILNTVLNALGGIWPGRISLHGVNLGDVWRHSSASFPGETNQLVPFHKLSQWMTYSLLEPLEWCGIKVTKVEELTGLAEYRNGGLFIDMNVIEPIRTDALLQEYAPGDEFIVEWRALTVALLDEVGREVRQLLGQSEAQMPLAKVLQGGTWAAGRKTAARLRKDGGSPVKIKSDATVF
ncbi:MAG: URC4/urg3 family protein [Proteobacteria bacterium]|nr:URC4/urg3 family protein [Pseudomonadota bacterium]